MQGLAEAAQALYEALLRRGAKIACAESCTGGLVTAALTAIPGSSDALWGGVAAYSNDCKIRLLGVAPELILRHGAVSREVARSMAEGAILAAGEGGAAFSLAITGIAGPGGGSEEKPVGLVWFAWREKGGAAFEESQLYDGDREAVREKAAEHAMAVAASLADGRRGSG